MQDIMDKFFKSFGPFSKQNLNDKVREERLRLFNTNDDNRTHEGFIKLAPKTEERIINVKKDVYKL